MNEPRDLTEVMYLNDLNRVQKKLKSAKMDRRDTAPFYRSLKKLTEGQLRHEVETSQAAKIRK